MNLHDILDLSNHGADTFVGKGYHRYRCRSPY